jgi:hypothetical protein
MDYSWHDFLGNIGVLLVLGVYLLLQMQKVSAATPSFSFVNAVGAILILVSLMQSFNLSAFIVEASWLLISLYGLVRSLNSRARAL